MKKYINSILSAVVLVFMAASCEDVLDVEPVSTVSDEQFWQTDVDAALGVAAIYDAMQKAYRTKHYQWGEFRSDNYVVTDRANADIEEMVTNNMSASNSAIARWNDFYSMIGRANLAIDKLPNIDAPVDGLLGEAYALRAYAYFDAIRVWGAVPLFTEPILSLDQELYRERTEGSTIMEDIVITDMLKAESLIETPSARFRFSLASVYALQANVYMWLQDYVKAKTALDKLVALDEYNLVTDRESWSHLFLNDVELGKFEEGPELIFSIKYELLEDGNRASGNYELFFAGVPSIWISPLLENKWIERFPTDSVAWYTKYPDFAPQTQDVDGNTLFGDWRYFESRENRDIGEARVAKYAKINYSPNEDDTDIVVYRYAGILLLKAEAENRLGNMDEALKLVNQIRSARQLPEATVEEFGATVEQRENFILDERQLELLAEGKRWWDLRRTGNAVDLLGPINGLTEEKLVFPIFDKHLIDNQKLTQNPGY